MQIYSSLNCATIIKKNLANIGYICPLLSFSERLVHLNLNVPDEGHSKKKHIYFHLYGDIKKD